MNHGCPQTLSIVRPHLDRRTVRLASTMTAMTVNDGTPTTSKGARRQGVSDANDGMTAGTRPFVCVRAYVYCVCVISKKSRHAVIVLISDLLTSGLIRVNQYRACRHLPSSASLDHGSLVPAIIRS